MDRKTYSKINTLDLAKTFCQEVNDKFLSENWKKCHSAYDIYCHSCKSIHVGIKWKQYKKNRQRKFCSKTTEELTKHKKYCQDRGHTLLTDTWNNARSNYKIMDENGKVFNMSWRTYVYQNSETKDIKKYNQFTMERLQSECESRNPKYIAVGYTWIQGKSRMERFAQYKCPHDESKVLTQRVGWFFNQHGTTCDTCYTNMQCNIGRVSSMKKYVDEDAINACQKNDYTFIKVDYVVYTDVNNIERRDRRVFYTCSKHGDEVLSTNIVSFCRTNESSCDKCMKEKHRVNYYKNPLCSLAMKYSEEDVKKMCEKRNDVFVELKSEKIEGKKSVRYVYYYCKHQLLKLLKTGLGEYVTGSTSCPKCCFKWKEYKTPTSKTLFYQGYENRLLDELFEMYPEEQIVVAHSQQIPKVRYYWNPVSTRVYRNYTSDIFIPNEQRMFDVKSVWTFWKMNMENFRRNLIKFRAVSHHFCFETPIYGRVKLLKKYNSNAFLSLGATFLNIFHIEISHWKDQDLEEILTRDIENYYNNLQCKNCDLLFQILSDFKPIKHLCCMVFTYIRCESQRYS